ncbi:MAG: NfeD family protein [Pseudomonadota bacterium]
MLTWILETLGPWTWWALGLILLGLEILVPGVYVMWFGLAALSVGTFALLVPTSWTVQILMFAVLSVIAVLVGRVVMKRTGADEDTGLNDRGARYVGRTFLLSEPIADGQGRVQIDDTIWRVSGPDLAAGRRVRVVAAEAARLIVETVDESEPSAQ